MPPAPSVVPAPPTWARLLDVLSVSLVALAFLVFLYGGFRERILGIRIALTEPDRMVAWGVIAAIIRHYFAPQRPIWADMPGRLRTLVRSREWRTAMLATIGTRPAILFIGYLAVFLIGYAPKQPAFRVSPNEFLNLQARWDAGWYFGIATEGYYFSYGMKERGEQQNIVFFPAYPLLMRVAGRLLGGTPPSIFFIGGTIASWLAFALALMYLFRFARDLLGDEERAAGTLWLVATYPFAVWFGATYTESLFLLGAVASLYNFQKGHVVAGGLWGLLVGFTRPNGCFLSIPLALLALRPYLPAWLNGGPLASGRALRAGRADEPVRPDPVGVAQPGFIKSMLCASLPGIAVLLYSAYIWQISSDPLSWAEGHAAWGRSYQGLWVLIEERVRFLYTGGAYAYSSQAPDDVLQVIGILFVLIPVWPVARRFGLAYAVFILINILPPLAAGGVLSAGRFSSVLFPAFIWAAAVIKPAQRPAWLSAFMAIQGLNAILFYTWREMF